MTSDHPVARWHLRVFIFGMTPTARHALGNLREICRAELDHEPEIEIVDLKKHPEEAVTWNVLAVPTVVRLSPEPVRKVIGDLSDVGRAVSGLSFGTD